MGFGLLYALFMGGAHTAKKIRDVIEDEKYKQKYHDDEAGIYYDSQMRKHDKKTGRIVTYQKDTKTGDMMVVDALTCRPIRNLTRNAIESHYEEERQKFLQSKTARTYVQYGNDEHMKLGEECRGIRYKDLKTEKLYVIREIDRNGLDYSYRGIGLMRPIHPICVSCLMDVVTGEFIRPTDGALLNSMNNEEYRRQQYEVIEKENNRKKDRISRKEKEKDKGMFYYNSYIHEIYSDEMCKTSGIGEELTDEQNKMILSKGKRLI